MKYVVVCPECHSEHAEPAEAYVGLFIICSDCVLSIEIHIARAESSSSLDAAA